MLTPILALTSWTLVVWLWMYAKRIPAMQTAKIEPDDATHPGSLNVLPADARVVADNYNHLHEQPTVFYALVVYAHLAGTGDGIMIVLAWLYVGLRILHSLTQIIARKVVPRFIVFALSSLVLIFMMVKNVIALF